MGNHVLLYIEDEDAAVFLLETALKEAEIAVQLYRVSDGEQALGFLRGAGAYQNAPKPDLILLDLNLPRKSGLEVLAELQKCESLRRIPTVVFTSSALPQDRKQSFALGAQEYITKPSSFDALVDAVRSVCSYLPPGSCEARSQ